MIRERDILREIEELHTFFQGWLGGGLPNAPEEFARFTSAMAEAFTMVPPDGRLISREELVDMLRAGHGGAGSGFRIWVREATAFSPGEGIWLAAYEEWQERGEGPRGRRSTAVFRERADAPGGVEWVRVHETWMPPQP